MHTFPHLCQEHCRDEFANVFIYSCMEVEERKRDESKCTCSGILQYLQRKAMMLP